MSELGPEDRSLIERGRGGYEPTERDRRRVRMSLAAALGASAGLSATTAGGVAAAGVATGATSLVTKVVVSVVVAGLAATGGVAVHRAKQPSPGRSGAGLALASHEARPHAAVTPVAPPSDDPMPAPVVGPADELDEPALPFPGGNTAASPTPRRLPLAEVTAAPPSTGEVVSPAPAAPALDFVTTARSSPPTTIEAETRLIRQAIDALRAGDPARALARLDEHARLYPGGVLAEEGALERVVALEALDRAAEARAAGEAFVRAHPGSPLAPRVRAACGLPPIPSRSPRTSSEPPANP